MEFLSSFIDVVDSSILMVIGILLRLVPIALLQRRLYWFCYAMMSGDETRELNEWYREFLFNNIPPHFLDRERETQYVKKGKSLSRINGKVRTLTVFFLFPYVFPLPFFFFFAFFPCLILEVY